MDNSSSDRPENGVESAFFRLNPHISRPDPPVQTTDPDDFTEEEAQAIGAAVQIFKVESIERHFYKNNPNIKR